jgi:hypothetical protein
MRIAFLYYAKTFKEWLIGRELEVRPLRFCLHLTGEGAAFLPGTEEPTTERA